MGCLGDYMKDLLNEGRRIYANFKKLMEIESPEIDISGTKCPVCDVGELQETSIHDDMDGTIHCNKCGIATRRYVRKDLWGSMLKRMDPLPFKKRRILWTKEYHYGNSNSKLK